jgi:hypothetical protein
MLLKITDFTVLDEKRTTIAFEKGKQLAEKTLSKIEANYFFSIIANSEGFEFSALLYTPFFASTDDPDEMYPVYFKIFTGEKKIVMLE